MDKDARGTFGISGKSLSVSMYSYFLLAIFTVLLTVESRSNSSDVHNVNNVSTLESRKDRLIILKNVTAEINENVSFSCIDPSNCENCIVYWRFYADTEYCPDDPYIFSQFISLIPMHGRELYHYKPTLRISNVSTMDAGWYMCVVRTPDNRIYSSQAWLQVLNSTLYHDMDLNSSYESPHINNRNYMGRHIHLFPGNVVSLKCFAGGIPKPNITWKKNGGLVKRTEAVKYRPYTLQLFDLTPDDEGRYTCDVCNILGCANFAYNVYLITDRNMNSPIINEAPKDITEEINKTAKFTCVPSQLDYFEIFWLFYKDKDLSPDSSSNTNLLVDINIYDRPNLRMKANDTILTISNITERDVGWYVCVVRTRFLRVEISQARLQIAERRADRPILINDLQNVTAEINETASFSCINPSDCINCTVRWLFYREPNFCPDDSSVFSYKGLAKLKNGSKITDTTLIIPNISNDDAGWYMCVVRTPERRIYSSLAWLEVLNSSELGLYLRSVDLNKYANSSADQKAPYFTDFSDFALKRKYYDLNPYAGNVVSLKCFADGIPKPNITWEKDGGPVKRTSGSVWYRAYTLQIFDLTPDDEGKYTCNVCNILGCVNFTYNVKIMTEWMNSPISIVGMRDVTAEINQTVRFICHPVGPPVNIISSISWLFYKDEDSFPDESFNTNLQVDDYEQNPDCPSIRKNIYENTILTISNITERNAGWYVCVVKIAYLKVEFSQARLQIADKRNKV